MLPERLDALSVSDLFALRSEIESELGRRGLSAKVGELGEWFAIEHFARTPGLPSLAAAPRGAKNIDAISKDGDRYSIKTIQKGGKTGTIYPSYVDGIEKVLFEYIVVVLLDEDFSLLSMYRLSWEQFVVVRSWDTRMSAYYLGRSKRVFSVAERVG